MRAVLIGTVEGSRTALRALAAVSGGELAGVVTLPPANAVRHSDYVDLTPDICAAGAEPMHATDVNAAAVLERIHTWRPDFVFVIGWSQICRPAVLATARRGAIGFHPAPLPRLRGRAPIPWTILLDEKISASTLFWIDAGIDSGPILLQRFFHVAPEETARTLYDKHVQAIGTMLPEACRLLESDDPPRTVQDEAVATFAAKRVAEDGAIDWRASAVEVGRLVRAVCPPYPGAFTEERGRRLVILAGEPRGSDRRWVGLPGQVLLSRDDGFLVRCGEGDLWVSAWRWEDDPAPAPLRLHRKFG